jgi:Ca2+-binding RTX toxin-like protein
VAVILEVIDSTPVDTGSTFYNGVFLEGSGGRSVTIGSGGAIFVGNWDNDTNLTVNGNVVAVDLQGTGRAIVTANGSKGTDYWGTLLTGSDNDDVQTGGARWNTIDLGSGNNTLHIGDGGVGKATMGDGDDTVTAAGTKGSDWWGELVTGAGNDTVMTGGGYFTMIGMGSGTNTLTIGEGGAEFVYMSGKNLLQKLTVQDNGFVGTYHGFRYTISQIDLKGSAVAANLRTRSGDDKITTKKGYVEHIETQAGKDKVLLGDGGAGSVRLGDGNDLLQLNSFDATWGLTARGGDGTDTLRFRKATTVDLSDPSTHFHSFEKILGSKSDDTITGNAAGQKIDGKAGADHLTGKGGADTLIAGNDTVTDSFHYLRLSDSKTGAKKRDKIQQFDSGEDKIDLSEIDANGGRKGDQAFTFGGATATANGVWTVSIGTNELVRADTDGDARADMEILVSGSANLVAGDFIL